MAISLLTMAMALVGPIGAQRASAVGTTITVDSAADTIVDAVCTLRAAIVSANTSAAPKWSTCENGTIGADTIQFRIRGGTINVASGLGQLPSIVDPVTIDGGTSRAKIHGYGSGTGITVNAAGSVIRNLVLDNFQDGIDVNAGSVTIAGNRIGPNSANGVYATAGGVLIGGNNTSNPDPCSGDCNVISGNDYGVYLAAGGTVKGNFIGTTADGTAANANGTGILVSSGTWTLGGTTAPERNLVSGNTHDGIEAHGCGCTILGNYVGTNLAGSAAIGNGQHGVAIFNGSATIGGTALGMGNLISGNGGSGVYIGAGIGTQTISIQGNRIGIKAGGGALGNGSHGIYVASSNAPTQIGLAGGTDGLNTIAFNGGAGVRVDGSKVSIRGNSIHDNGGKGISNFNPIQVPTIAGNAPLNGTSCAGCSVDIYSDNADEGRTYEGSTIADGSGNWTFSGSPGGPNVTATTNTGGGTSDFSLPTAAAKVKRPDGRIKKGSGSLIGNDVYNTDATNQTLSGSKSPGNKIVFTISLQNDGSKDSFRVAASGGTVTGYVIKFFRGTTNITAAVVAGTYQTASLAKGSTVSIKAKVKVTSTAAKGSSVSRLVTVTSVGDGSKQDAVKLIVSRS